MNTLTQDARDNALSHAEEIHRLMAALEVDFDQLEELKDFMQDLREDLAEVQEELDAVLNTINAEAEDEEKELQLDVYCSLNELAADVTDKIRAAEDELAKLQAIAGDFTDSDDVATELHNYPLSIDVRSGWTPVGGQLEAAEYSILLTTGGPAARIWGELDDDGTPTSARMEAQDWGTPWTDVYTDYDDALLEFAQFIIPR